VKGFRRLVECRSTKSLFSAQDLDEEDEPKPIPQFKFDCQISQIFLSVIDKKPQEILLFHVKELMLQYESSEQHDSFEFQIFNLQIDNQLFWTPRRAVLYRSGNGKKLVEKKYLFLI
jgi:hypothetical protein